MTLKHIAIWICEDCINGRGKQCHTPGCALYLHNVDLPIDARLFVVLGELPTPEEDYPDIDNRQRAIDQNIDDCG